MWIARDWDGLLFLHSKKPYKKGFEWVNDGNDPMLIKDDTFSEVQWKDEEPTEVKLIVKREYYD